MSSSPVQEIKDRLDVVEAIKGYISLGHAGRNMKGLCPFHREKTPSFMVSPERQSWHCFGCGAGGDIFTFVMKYENIEFGEALRLLAEKAGVELKRSNPQEYRQFGLLYEINEAAKDFFILSLHKEPRAIEYLSGRGLKKDTIDEFGIGWAPPSQDSLTVELVKKGYNPDDILRAGLALRTERGMRIDRFRGRIMFPIHNHSGKVAGFTGRISPGLEQNEVAKYINSPETPIFAKSKLLYGFFASKPFVRDKGSAFMVEGQMDFLMSWQAGVKNAVATSGTALTEDHLRTLRRLCETLILRFDTDDAGYDALERAIDLAESHDFGVRVAVDGAHKDPADAAKEDPEIFLSTIKSAVPAQEFYFHRYFPEDAANEPDFRNREYLSRLRIVLAKLKNIASPVTRATWLKELSRRIGVDESALAEEMENIKVSLSVRDRDSNEPETAAPKERTRWELLSERVLAHVAAEDEDEFLKSCSEFLEPRYMEAAQLLVSGKRKSEKKETDELLHVAVLAAERFPQEELETLLGHLKRECVLEKRKFLVQAVQLAEKNNDSEALSSALSELAKLSVV